MARALLTWIWNHFERPPVLSVTPDTAATLSVQAAPSKSARTDQTPAQDSFSVLIDSNAADTAGSDRPTAPDRPSQTPRRDETSAAPDSRQLRDNSSSAAPNTPSQGTEPGTSQTAAAGGAAGTVAASKPGKPGGANSGIAKPTV